jgi:2,4-diaminopentanoate dehydrogenase
MDKYRVILWGPGYTGQGALREIARRPELELVGCLAYNPDKAGKDAMELVGEPPAGVLVTTDKEQIYALDADIVLYAARAMPDESERQQEMVRLLSSGKNVTTTTAYHFPWQRGEDYVAPLEQACRAGGTTLHGTGVHPGWFIERQVLTATGLNNMVDEVHVREIVDISHHAGEAISGAGFGMKPERLGKKTRKMILSRYYFETLAGLSHTLGLGVQEMTASINYLTSDREMVCAGLHVAEGTVAVLDATWSGLVDGKPVITIREIWYLAKDLVPNDVQIVSPDMYEYEIKGLPLDITGRVDLNVSDRRDVFRIDDLQSGGNLATSVQLITTIPAVVAAQPGILIPPVFAYPARDLHSVINPLATRPKRIPETIL